MKTALFFTLFFTSTLFGITLDEIISKSLDKNPSLESINARVQANKQDIDIADQFSSPELLLTKNTLDSKQAMSQTVLTLKQKIPFYSKRSSKQNVALAEENILEEKLYKAKVALVANLKNEAYTVWELKEQKSIIHEYINLTKQNIELYESYTSTSSNQHMGIMKAKLSLSDLKIQESSLNAKISSALARLSYLAAFEVKELELELKIAKIPELSKLQNSLSNNPDLALKTKELLKEDAKIKVANINNYPDINLLAGYSYRENFDNYFNLGVGLSLPIYSTEDAMEQKARAMKLVVASQKEDVTFSINSTLKVYHAQMLSAYEIYHIIQDDSLPQLEHMFELSNSSISTGSDLFKYIDVLFSKLSLERKSINAVTNYNRSYAKISQLLGELK